ncbi:hypothetical protein AB0P02_28280 [Streptomyces griseoluteus]|uniref:hypothetical protein n=1 Tax=Streptomyces griseoluteus TaxID=29306 RepID=UPI00342593D9
MPGQQDSSGVPRRAALLCSGGGTARGAVGRTTTGAGPAELGRAVLAAYLVDRDSRGETFRVVVRTDHGNHVVITADQLTGPCREADPVVCQALPAYLRNALT